MKTIILDTATSYLSIGIYEGDTCLSKFQQEGNKRQSEDTITRLEIMLKECKINLLDINEMVITIGPGSYTGVRIALTIAKTLAAVSNIRVKIISSLQSYIGNGDGIAVIDARSNKVYVGCYLSGNPIIPDQLMDIDEFTCFKENYPDLEVFGDGDLVGFSKTQTDIIENIAGLMNRLEVVEDVDSLVPNYIKQVNV